MDIWVRQKLTDRWLNKKKEEDHIDKFGNKTYLDVNNNKDNNSIMNITYASDKHFTWWHKFIMLRGKNGHKLREKFAQLLTVKGG